MFLHARKFAGVALTASLVTMGGIGTTVVSADAAHAATCPTASQIVSDLNSIEASAGSVNRQLSALSSSSSPGNVQSAAQATTAGLGTMSSDLTADADALNGCPALNSTDSQTVVSSFDGLVGTTTQTLNTLTGKHPIFAQFLQTAPIAASLRHLEAAFDSYSFALVAAVSSQQDAITRDQNNLDAALSNTISTYTQVCIPSPLYPIVPPVCVSA